MISILFNLVKSLETDHGLIHEHKLHGNANNCAPIVPHTKRNTLLHQCCTLHLHQWYETVAKGDDMHGDWTYFSHVVLYQVIRVSSYRFPHLHLPSALCHNTDCHIVKLSFCHLAILVFLAILAFLCNIGVLCPSVISISPHEHHIKLHKQTLMNI